MQEEVKENKRFKITGRGMSHEKLFANPKLTPTVGAGGQYSVNVQKPQQTSWERLANGLGSMMAAGSAIQQSDVAASELAQQQVADASLEDLARMKRESMELEDSMYKANGFVDRLTRTGKASVIENPLTFSRAQSAYGARIAQEEYQGELNKRLAEAKLNAKKDPKASYSPVDIQKELSDEFREKYSLDNGGSATNAFDRSVAAFNKNTLTREFNEATKIADAHQTLNLAPAWKNYTEIISNENTSQAEKDEALKKINQSGAGLGLSSINKSMILYGQEMVSDGDFVGLRAFIKQAKDSKNVIGGYPLGSPAYAETLNRLEYMADKLEDDEDKKGSISNAKVEAEFRDIANVLSSKRGDDVFSMEESYGVEGLDKAESYEQAWQILQNNFRDKARKGGFLSRIDSAVVDVESNLDSYDERQSEKLGREAQSTVNDTLKSNKEGHVLSLAIDNAKDEFGNNNQAKLKVAELEGTYRARLLGIENSVERGDYPEGATQIVDDNDNVIPYPKLGDDQKKAAVVESMSHIASTSQEALGDIRKSEQDRIKEEVKDKAAKKSAEENTSKFKSTFDNLELGDRLVKNLEMTDNDMYNAVHMVNGDEGIKNYVRDTKPKGESLKIIKNINKAIKAQEVRGSRPITLRSGRIVTPSFTQPVDESQIEKMKIVSKHYNDNTIVSVDELPNDSYGYMASRDFYLRPDNVRDLKYDGNIPDEVLLERLRVVDSSLSLADIKTMKHTAK